MTGMLLCAVWGGASSPVYGLLERIQPGVSARFVVEETGGDEDYFELGMKDGKIRIAANSAVNAAAGLNWYLKYYAGVHLSWNGMTASLPDTLPPVPVPERRTTDQHWRYYLNYCTHSYSMAFWDWERWEMEIDWMALHGINMPLAVTGTDVVWRNMMLKLGYSKDEVNSFVAGPAFQGWWLMNNLEGWGGPNSDKWYDDREALQKRILARMREYGMTSVLPGYGGMVPHDAAERLGLEVAGQGLWNSFTRPAFLQPTDPKFDEIADLYYGELEALYGQSGFYSMDPFHEGGSTEGIDLTEAGCRIHRAMRRASPGSVWVLQGWNNNPRRELIAGIDPGDLMVLDLASETYPQWGGESDLSPRREGGYGQHEWIYCMLLNFGGNVGLHGKMDCVISEYYKARGSRYGATLKGVGLTMEGIENNPVMYELLTELPWRQDAFSKEEWLDGYVNARYGAADADISRAWTILANSIYNCPATSTQQGTSESVFCARPGMDVWQVSNWSGMTDYYDPAAVIEAAGEFVKAADRFRGDNNYEYDLVDIVRQAVAEAGRLMYRRVTAAVKAGDVAEFDARSRDFLNLIMLQDRLLATRGEFRVGRWIADARRLAPTAGECDLMEWNARVQITTWGPRECSEDGGLRDYAHREWNGVLADLYHRRWSCWFELQRRRMAGEVLPDIDYYAVDSQWAESLNVYNPDAEGDAVDVAREVYRAISDLKYK